MIDWGLLLGALAGAIFGLTVIYAGQRLADRSSEKYMENLRKRREPTTREQRHDPGQER